MNFRQRWILRAALRTHLTAAWPESIERGREIDGVDLVMADANIYGWALASSRNDLTEADRRHLSSLADGVEGILPSLPDDARRCFEGLTQLARTAARFRSGA